MSCGESKFPFSHWKGTGTSLIITACCYRTSRDDVTARAISNETSERVKEKWYAIARRKHRPICIDAASVGYVCASFFVSELCGRHEVYVTLFWSLTDIRFIARLSSLLTLACVRQIKQESLADAKVSARQQCVYEGALRRNLQEINDMRFPNSNRGHITYGLRDIFVCRGWKSPFSPTVFWL